MWHRRAAIDIEECRQKIDHLHNVVTDRAAGCIGTAVGIKDDQRHTRCGIMKMFFFAHPVIAQIIAVIRGEDNHRFIGKTAIFEMLEQPPHLVINLLDQPHIGRDHRLPDLVTGKAA